MVVVQNNWAVASNQHCFQRKEVQSTLAGVGETEKCQLSLKNEIWNECEYELQCSN